MELMEKVSHPDEETLLERSVRFRRECARLILETLDENPHGVYAVTLYRLVEENASNVFGEGSYTWDIFESHLTWLRDRSAISIAGETVIAA